MHAEAAKCCPNTEKVHYHAGRFHDNVLARALAVARRRDGDEAWADGFALGLRKEQVKTSERNGKMLAAFTTHLPNVIKCYVLSLKRGMRHAALAVSRMLFLWLEFADLQCQAYGGAGQSGHRRRGCTLRGSGGPDPRADGAPVESASYRTNGCRRWRSSSRGRRLPTRARGQSSTGSLACSSRRILRSSRGRSCPPPSRPSRSARSTERAIVAQAKHKLMGQQQQQVQDDGRNHHDVLSIAKRLVEQLKKLSQRQLDAKARGPHPHVEPLEYALSHAEPAARHPNARQPYRRETRGWAGDA